MTLHFNRRIAVLAAAASFTVLGACASTSKVPVAELATARESVAQAESAGATQLAPVEMLAARDKLGRAENAVRQKDYEDARRLTDEATADADLAERKARAAKSMQAAQELQRSNSVLSNEIQRQTPQ